MSNLLSLSNPVFKAYAICTTVLALKMTVIAWHTVQRMLASGRGNRAPEDINPGACNPKPLGKVQVEPFEPTDRLRRMMSHDVENNVGFFAVGLLYVLCEAGEAWPLWAYTGTKVFNCNGLQSLLQVIHHFVYLAGMPHEARATFWTATSGAFIFMSYKVLSAALHA